MSGPIRKQRQWNVNLRTPIKNQNAKPVRSIWRANDRLEIDLGIDYGRHSHVLIGTYVLHRRQAVYLCVPACCLQGDAPLIWQVAALVWRCRRKYKGKPNSPCTAQLSPGTLKGPS